jgi:hypothetical protein
MLFFFLCRRPFAFLVLRPWIRLARSSSFLVVFTLDYPVFLSRTGFFVRLYILSYPILSMSISTLLELTPPTLYMHVTPYGITPCPSAPTQT